MSFEYNNRTRLDFSEAVSPALLDFYGNEYRVGDKVIKAITVGRAASLEERVVLKIEGDKIFLDSGRPVALNYPRRCVNISALQREIINDHNRKSDRTLD